MGPKLPFTGGLTLGLDVLISLVIAKLTITLCKGCGIKFYLGSYGIHLLCLSFP